MAASDLKKKRSALPEPAIRKSFFYLGGGAVGAAVIAFILMTFVLGGGGGEVAAVAGTQTSVAGLSVTPTPKAAQPAGLKPGGRDPFGVAAPTPAPTPAPSVQPIVITPTGDDPVPPPTKQREGARVETELHAWQVTAIGDGVASFVVDKKRYTGIKLGEDVIKSYTLIQIRDRCVMIDNGPTRFSLCLGDPPKKV